MEYWKLAAGGLGIAAFVAGVNIWGYLAHPSDIQFAISAFGIFVAGVLLGQLIQFRFTKEWRDLAAHWQRRYYTEKRERLAGEVERITGYERP